MQFFMLMSAVLTANFFTAVFIYCVTIYVRKGNDLEEVGSSMCLWIIVMVFLMLFYGWYEWGMFSLIG